MTLNKVNLCWVLSEGRKGHEIQSMTLAQLISDETHIQHFSIRQPWLSFAPRIIPRFKQGLKWRNPINLNATPEVIITTGRQAAAAGKHLRQILPHPSKHIQILNPKDNLSHYDLVLAPAHDQLNHPHAISYSGSLHPYNKQWFEASLATPLKQKKIVAVVLGNPHKNYFKQRFVAELAQVQQLYPSTKIIFCGSPRLPATSIKRIKQLLHKNETYWFGPDDGDNPYQAILKYAQHVFVTADSINMINECAASQALLTLLARDYIPSPKHRRFIDSLSGRWSDFTHKQPNSFAIPYAPDQVLQSKQFQKLLNSPNSSSSG